MVKRQLPNPSEIFELLHFKTPELNPRRRRLDAALTTWDLRKIAKRRTPAAAFDYTDGSAEAELSIERARQAFADIENAPARMSGIESVEFVSDVRTGLGTRWRETRRMYGRAATEDGSPRKRSGAA